ncbi:MAG TPA: CPBP family intramembrane glutamic endopeptidase [Candidatus Dormibacteraeota bacterium]|nr:CPBP family intramembrane glutamic endopeptidase [Candidatus Dormibacteraeota bacterium]
MISGDELSQAAVVAGALVVFVFVLAAANLGDRSSTWRVIAFAGVGGVCAIVALLSIVNIVTVVAAPGLVSVSGVSTTRVLVGNALELTGAVAAPFFLLPWVRVQLARFLRSFRPESSVNAVAACLYVLVTTVFLSLQVSTDQLKAIKQSGASPSLLFIIGTNQLPFLVVAFAGVGLFVKRGFRDTLQRLGLYWPGWRWIAISAAFAVALVAFGVAFDLLITKLTPEQSKSINEVSQQLLSNVTNPFAAVALALAAGIGEELLFRGALQPRLGIVAAALLFAVLHTQYSISLASLEIFILGLALGLLRKRAGVTGTIIAHAGYDLILLMIPFVIHK